MADITITAANVRIGVGVTPEVGIAGATITAGQACYKDSAGLWQLSDADGAAALRVVDGIAITGSSSGVPILIQRNGLITIGGTVVVNMPYSLSATAGGICPIADTVADSGAYGFFIGWGVTTTQILLGFFPSGVATP